MKLDNLHNRIRDLFIAELAVAVATGSIPDAMERETERAFAQCPGGECCDQCAEIFCPYGEPLHFHHDGCPCCSNDADDRPARMQRWKTLLKRNQRS